MNDHEVLLHVRRFETDAGMDESLRVLRDRRLQARPGTLREWGVAAPSARRVPDGEGGYWQSLHDVPGLKYRYDSCTQELLLDLTRTQRGAYVREARGLEHPLPQPAETPGGFLNVDVQAVSGAQPSWNALTELGAFAGAGHGLSSMLLREGEVLRLETHWVHDDPGALRQWVIGDAISREAPGRRPVRFGGLSWGTEFRLQPDIVTFPLPALRGDAVLPSTVDVYVDGVLRQRDEVPPGPFELRGVPVTSGGGEMRAVVRDLLGREQTLAQPFYVSPRLLRTGLDDYRFEGGWLRQRFGAVANDYGPAFAAAAWRRGLNDRYTTALGADASAGRQALGLGLATQLAGFVAANAELSGSHSRDGAGGQAQLGLQHNGRAFSASLDLRAATPFFSALGETRPPARHALSAYAGLPLRGGDSVSLTAILESRRDEGSLRLVAGNYTARLGSHWLLGAQLTHTDGDGGGWVGGASVSRLWGRASVSAYAQRNGDNDLVRASWQQSPEQALGLGYQVDLEHLGLGDGSASDRALAQLRWAQERGVLSAAVEDGDQGSAIRYGLQTGFAFLDGSGYLTRPVQGSFAVVEAGDVEGVRIYRDHQLVARTDAEGRALVPELRPYEVNHISIELADLPIEQRADAAQLTLVPYARSGATLKFPVSAPVEQRWLRLRLADGSWLPPGAWVEVPGGRGEVLLGTEGRVLLQDVPAGTRIEARWRGGRCASRLPPQQGLGEEVLTCAVQ